MMQRHEPRDVEFEVLYCMSSYRIFQVKSSLYINNRRTIRGTRQPAIECARRSGPALECGRASGSGADAEMTEAGFHLEATRHRR